jgi:hypothetical protein
MWQAPSCRDCNEANGRNEDNLRLRLGLCVDRDVAASSGIPQKVIRALNPSLGKNSKDAALRKLRRDKILRELKPVSKVRRETFMPNSGPAAVGSLAIPIPFKNLHILGRKLVRGATYVLNDRLFIESDYTIDIHVVNEVGAAAAMKLIVAYGGTHHRGPGIQIGHARVPADPQAAIFAIEIWGKFQLHATVVPGL